MYLIVNIMTYGLVDDGCDGCPPMYCNEEPAVVTGYCCGCGSYFGNL